MGKTTEIAWCDSTFNPFIGCTKVSPGCDNCYAEQLMDRRFHRVQWGPHGERKRTSAANWQQPVDWNARARSFRASFGRRRRVFCASLADVFDNQVPEEWRHDLWRLIRDTPHLNWLLLTKRPENMARFLPASWWDDREAWSNVWLGFTAEDQEHFDRRWPIMREIPAVVRFCSYEPAIGPLRLPPLRRLDGSRIDGDAEGLNWLICGGESGKGHRPMPLEWESAIREDCRAFGIPYFFKQLAGKQPIPADFPLVRQFPEVSHV